MDPQCSSLMPSFSSSQVETKKTFQDLIKPDGLQVVKHTEVPSNFESIDVELNFPEHWHPDQSAVASKSESETVLLDLHSKLTGVFGDVPEMTRIFAELDAHLFGGRCRLQPGNTLSNFYLIHQFTTLFALWDEIIEADTEFGLASADRLRRILKVRRQDSKAVQTILNEDSRDASFMVCWEKFFADVNSASEISPSNGCRPLYKRFEKSFLTWLDGIQDEMNHLCLLESSKLDIQKQWSNRIKSVGCIPIFDLLLQAAAFSPTDDLYSELHGIRWVYARLVREINEIASIPKDVADESGSLFTSTMILHQTSFNETLEYFIERFNQSVAEFDELAKLVSEKATKKDRQDLDAFLVALRYSAVGWGDWHLPAPSMEGKGMRYNRVKILHPAGKKVFHFSVSSQ